MMAACRCCPPQVPDQNPRGWATNHELWAGLLRREALEALCLPRAVAFYVASVRTYFDD